jgi:hypothetical protein
MRSCSLAHSALTSASPWPHNLAMLKGEAQLRSAGRPSNFARAPASPRCARPRPRQPRGSAPARSPAHPPSGSLPQASVLAAAAFCQRVYASVGQSAGPILVCAETARPGNHIVPAQVTKLLSVLASTVVREGSRRAAGRRCGSGCFPSRERRSESLPKGYYCPLLFRNGQLVEAKRPAAPPCSRVTHQCRQFA